MQTTITLPTQRIHILPPTCRMAWSSEAGASSCRCSRQRERRRAGKHRPCLLGARERLQAPRRRTDRGSAAADRAGGCCGGRLAAGAVRASAGLGCDGAAAAAIAATSPGAGARRQVGSRGGPRDGVATTGRPDTYVYLVAAGEQDPRRALLHGRTLDGGVPPPGAGGHHWQC